MKLFSVVTERCTGCGLCARACPASLVRQPKEGQPPVALVGREEHCILCGHCVIHCPSGAFVHARLAPQVFEPLRRRELPDPASLRRLFMARRSCRLYDPTPVPREDLLSLLESVRHAPTGHNARQVGYVVASGPQRMDVLRQAVLEWIDREVAAGSARAAELHLAGAARAVARGKDVLFLGAPHAVVVHALEAGITPREDAVIAGAWLELAAQASGLGACWCGYLLFALAGHPAVGELLGIPAGHRGYAALLLGRPAARPVSVPPRSTPDVRFF